MLEILEGRGWMLRGLMGLMGYLVKTVTNELDRRELATFSGRAEIPLHGWRMLWVAYNLS